MQRKMRFIFLLCCCTVLPLSSKPWKIIYDQKICQTDRIVHWFRATNETDVVYFIFAADTHVRPPAIIMVHSPFMGSILDVNCTAYVRNDTFRNSITVGAATGSYGVILYQVCDYPDLTNSAKIPEDEECTRYFGSNLRWKLHEPEGLDKTEHSISFIGTQYNESHDEFMDGGSIEIKFAVYERNKRNFHPSYYEVAAGIAVEVTVVINRLKLKYLVTRVSPVLFVYSNQSLEDDDDFAVYSGYPAEAPAESIWRSLHSYLILSERVKAGRVDDGGPPAFISFPPFCSVDMEPNDEAKYYRSANLGPRKPIVHKGRAHKFSYSIVYAYYGNRFNQIHQGSHAGYVGARKQFINLGNPGDGYFMATNYTSWSFILSLGSPMLRPADPGSSIRVLACLLTVGFIIVSSLTVVAVLYRRQHLRSAVAYQEIEQRSTSPLSPHRLLTVRKLTFSSGTRRADHSLIEPLISTLTDSYNATQHSE